MNYELVRYFRLDEYSSLDLPTYYWAIVYRLPGDLTQRVVFARAEAMTDELARTSIELDITTRAGAPTP